MTRKAQPSAEQTGATADGNASPTASATGMKTASVTRLSDHQPPSSLREQKALVSTVAHRELRTVLRTRAYLLLVVAVTAVLVGTTWIGGGMQAGYVPAIVDLLTPLELLVPIVAIAFGYRAITDDKRRGELDIVHTYPLSSWHIVAGIYLGRAVGVTAAIVVPLGVVATGVVVTEPDVAVVYATHAGADSPVLFVRFLVLTVGFALTMLAVALAVSAIASAARTAIALAVLVLVVLLLGADLALIYGFSTGIIGDRSLIYSLALSPLSAYRGLVLETAVIVASGVGPRTAAPLASLLGLGLWTVVSLAVAILGVRR